MSTIETKFLTYQEAAKFLRCGEKTLFNRIKAGKIRPIRNGRLVRFTEEILTKFLQQENGLDSNDQPKTEDTGSN